MHRVSVPAPFAVAKYEVTFTEWAELRSARGGCRHDPHDWGWGRGDRPVIDVSWEDAHSGYVDWLSTQTGKRSSQRR